MKNYALIPKLQFILFILVLIPVTFALGDNNTLSESIGAYTAGCIRQSAALPKDGKGYQVIRLGRGRYFAHPETIEYITDLSAMVSDNLDGILLIGDIAQQTGGPMLDDHSSHQTGLDADIFFWQHPIAKQRTLTIVEREHIHPNSLLTTDKLMIDDFKWDEVHGEILKLASSDDRVDRIFVNPLIKKKLCEIYGEEEWLGKLRPWFGHDGHFHVRLKCPAGSTMCKPQAPVYVIGSGCTADLYAWFTEEGRIKKKRMSGSGAQKRLPQECIQIMNGYK